jgi:hypothetical protein
MFENQYYAGTSYVLLVYMCSDHTRNLFRSAGY